MKIQEKTYQLYSEVKLIENGFKINSQPFNIYSLRYFKKQLQLAKDYKMPIFLHCRGESSYIDLFKIMREVLQKSKFPEAVVHSFTSGLDDAKLCLEHGCYIGLNGV